jgi:hypothetical protein
MKVYNENISSEIERGPTLIIEKLFPEKACVRNVKKSCVRIIMKMINFQDRERYLEA